VKREQGAVECERRSLPEAGAAASSQPVARAAPVTREEFSASFDRCFDRVYAYVVRRVSDRASCQRIVAEVLAANLDLLAERRDEKHELSRLKAASDRLIGLESAPPTPGPSEAPGPSEGRGPSKGP
jgi:hypothetical protein